MSFDSAIIAHFGGDTTDLKSATDEAAIMMKGFSGTASRAVREIGQGFVGAVVFMEAIKGIKEVATAEMDAAEQARQMSDITGVAITEQQQAWLDLKDGIGDAKSGLLGFAANVLSIFPEMGDDVGGFINSMRGISPEAQKQYTDMANTAETTLARIKAAHDKFLADLPAATKQANDKIAALSDQLAATEESNQDRITDLYQKEAGIVDQMSKTDENSLAYKQLKIQLLQTELAIQTAQATVAKQQIESDTQSFDAKKDSMTIEEQVTALTAQQLQYQRDAAGAAGDEAEQENYKNAAAALGKQIAADTLTIRKATELSEEDQLAIFIKETPALANLNTLTDDGLQLLQQQSAEKKTQYQIDQLLSLGVNNLNDAQKAQLATLVQQSAELKTQIGITQDAVNAENQLATATDKVAAAEQKIVEATQEQVDDADKVSGGLPAYQTIITQSGVGAGNQQLLDSQSVARSKQNIESLEANLAQQINGYQNSDDPSEEALVPGLQAKINALHQQDINISPTNLNGIAPPPYTAPNSAQQAQQQIQLLQGIHDAVVPALKTG